MEGKKHEILEQKMCKELDLLEQKYENNPSELSLQDVEKIEAIYHALKCRETYLAMKESREYEEMEGMSGRRGRAANGRYVSRDARMPMSGYPDASYGYSWHYPMYPEEHYPRW